MIHKKDYVLIAGVIKNIGYKPTRKKMARIFADRLEFDNPKFDRDKFAKACGVEAESGG